MRNPSHVCARVHTHTYVLTHKHINPHSSETNDPYERTQTSIHHMPPLVPLALRPSGEPGVPSGFCCVVSIATPWEFPAFLSL